MDPQRFKETYQRLQTLDERLTYKLRGRGSGLSRPGMDQLEQQVKDISTFAIELKEILEELMLAIAGKPSQPEQPGQ